MVRFNEFAKTQQRREYLRDSFLHSRDNVPGNDVTEKNETETQYRDDCWTVLVHVSKST